MSKRKVAPVLQAWLRGGAVYEVDLDAGNRELRALLAVARAAERPGVEMPSCRCKDHKQMHRALSRLRAAQSKGRARR